jgi:hypothetical protein
MLGTLKRTVGTLDRVTAWLTVSGMINVVPGFVDTTSVMTSCSELLLDLFGSEIGQHARSA